MPRSFFRMLGGASVRHARQRQLAQVLFLALGQALAVTVLPAPAAAQPVGSEFQINTYTTNDQRVPSVASDASGNFVVVWNSYYQDGSSWGNFGQRYDSAGVALGSEFQVNSYTTDIQQNPKVASDASGNFVVVWDRFNQDRFNIEIFGQRYDSEGVAQGGEFRVNSYTPQLQSGGSVAFDASGNFVVVWNSAGQDGSGFGIFGQRYDSGGVAQGGEFRVNSYTTSTQSGPSVASDASGNFVVVWMSQGQDGHYYGIFGKRYDSAGVPQGDEFRVNSYTTANQTSPRVTSDASGNFVVVWNSYSQDGSADGIFGQRYDSAGFAQGDEFRVNSYTTFEQNSHSVASDASGNFVVVWASRFQDGSSSGVFGQRYDSGGLPQGGEFQINSYTTNYQFLSSVAATGINQFVVAWESGYQDGSYFGIFGQRFDFGQSPGELLVNGGFEGGNCNPWVFSESTNCVQGGPWPHSGAGYAQLGKNNSNGRIYQQVTIPPSAPANLTFWLNVDTHETTPSMQNDTLFIEVRDPNGVLLATLGTFSNLDGAPPGVYSQHAFSMAAFAGQTVRLTFHVVSNTSLPTIFRVDDASLQ